MLHWSSLFSVSHNSFFTTYSFIWKQLPPIFIFLQQYPTPHINFYIIQLAALKATPKLQWLATTNMFLADFICQQVPLGSEHFGSVSCMYLHIQGPKLKGQPLCIIYAFSRQKGRARGIKSHLKPSLESSIVTSHIPLTNLSMMEWGSVFLPLRRGWSKFFFPK